jgi:hypothetical protein
MSYLYVKWNSFGRGLLASSLAIKAYRASPWPLPERRPATPEAARLGRSGGSGQRRSFRRVSFQRHPHDRRPAFCITSDLPVNRQESGPVCGFEG